MHWEIPWCRREGEGERRVQELRPRGRSGAKLVLPRNPISQVAAPQLPIAVYGLRPAAFFPCRPPSRSFQLRRQESPMKPFLVALCLCLAPALASAAQYEFAYLTFADGGLRWVDQAGERVEKGNDTATKVFAELSGVDGKLARSAQSRVLVLNGLSKSGWELGQGEGSGGGEGSLFKREVSAAARAATPAAARAEARRPAPPPDGRKPEAPVPNASVAESKKTDGAKPDETRIPVTFTGGGENQTPPHGRPGVLVPPAPQGPG